MKYDLYKGIYNKLQEMEIDKMLDKNKCIERWIIDNRCVSEEMKDVIKSIMNKELTRQQEQEFINEVNYYIDKGMTSLGYILTKIDGMQFWKYTRVNEN